MIGMFKKLEPKGENEMVYDYSKLNGKSVEVCGSQAEFARRMEMSQHSVSHKLNNKVGFRQDEIETALDVLGIARDQVADYFFTRKVQVV